MPFDVIIIGSGFGGAITACRLSQAGYRVLVLERGRRWDKTNFPRKPEDRWLWSHDRPESENGWLDLRLFPGMSVAAGAAVGGGSLDLRQHLLRSTSSRLPTAAGAPRSTYQELKPHYDTVAAFMDVQPVPDSQWTGRMKLMRDAAVAAGYGDRFKKLDLAVTFDPNWTYDADFAKGEAGSNPFTNKHGAQQGTCVHLGNCDIGCDVLAKNTLDRNYLYVAENQCHAEIRPLHLVDRIEPLPGGTYRVSFDSLETGQRVAGLGNRSHRHRRRRLDGLDRATSPRPRYPQNTSPAQQRHSACTGAATAIFSLRRSIRFRDVDASKGPTIAAAIDFEDGSQNGKRFWIQDGGIPDLAVSYLLRKADDPATSFKTKMIIDGLRKFLQVSDPLRVVMPWFAQGDDQGDGTLKLTSPTCVFPRRQARPRLGRQRQPPLDRRHRGNARKAEQSHGWRSSRTADLVDLQGAHHPAPARRL